MLDKKTKVSISLALIGCCVLGTGILLGINKIREKDSESLANGVSLDFDETIKGSKELKATEASSSEIYNSEDIETNLYGNWKIEKIAGEGRVTAYTDEGKNRILGSKLYYSKELAKYNDSRCENPIFKETKISVDAFCKNNKITKDTLGLIGSNITIINISSNGENWDDIGNNLLVMEDGTILAENGGVYFKLVRA